VATMKQKKKLPLHYSPVRKWEVRWFRNRKPMVEMQIESLRSATILLWFAFK
jgi:hypothetical protein